MNHVMRVQFENPSPYSLNTERRSQLHVRLVTDLLSLIRHRFGFSRRARLSLFLEGALLPPTESARLVRDNDSLRVKLEEVVAEDSEETDNGFFCTSRQVKKRHRQKLEEEGFSRSEEGRHKREKKRNKHNPEYASCREETSVNSWDSQKKYKKRKRKEEISGRERLTEGKEESSTGQFKKLKKTEREKELATKRKDGKHTKAAGAKMILEQVNDSFPLNSGRNNTKKVVTQSKNKTAGASDSDSSSTSSDSDSSEVNVKQNKSSHKPVVAALPRNASQIAANSDVKTGVSSKVTVKSKAENSTKTAVSKKSKKSQSASSDSDSSAEDDKSDSSDSETLVMKKPKANAGPSNSVVRNGDKQSPASIQAALPSPVLGRGRGTGDENFWRGSRGRGFRGMTRGRGRGRGENQGFFYNYDSEGQKQRQLNEAVTNTSVLVQNPVEVPKRNYSVLPLLAAPPQVGERIAFKEGKIISWNADKKQIELEILSSPAEPGKFDLVYQSADGAELIEYAVSQDTKITESWDSLIEPRLIVEPLINGSSLENGKI
uniref:Coilin n=1 Tax=Apteryx owenii TaxID=8824 RepID=A0A8B9P393_APTOW